MRTGPQLGAPASRRQGPPQSPSASGGKSRTPPRSVCPASRTLAASGMFSKASAPPNVSISILGCDGATACPTVVPRHTGQ
ncbi:hypothetical protein VULLAG_LOCUS5291 [Vulpes lagopus]